MYVRLQFPFNTNISRNFPKNILQNYFSKGLKISLYTHLLCKKTFVAISFIFQSSDSCQC